MNRYFARMHLWSSNGFTKGSWPGFSRKFLAATLTFLCLCLAATGRADTVVSLDLRSRILNVDSGNGLKAYRLDDTVEVRVNGIASQIEQLKPGMQVMLGFLNPQTVNRIQASEAAKVPMGAMGGSRRVSMSMRVDGDDLIHVRDGKIWIEHKGWQHPSDIRINGRAWKVVWNGKMSDEFTTFTPPLAPFNGAVVEIKKFKGRGSAVITQQPTNENNQTLIIHVNDTPPQAGNYDLVFGWDGAK